MPALAIHPGPPPGIGSLVLEMRVASRVDQVPQLVAQLSDAAITQQLIAPADRDWFRLCVDEALGNAMIHGNEADPQLPVVIRLAQDQAHWRLTIHDAGSGFGPQAVPDADAPGDPSREHGRGIRLMRSWLDRLEYYHAGALVLLERQKSGGGRDASSGVADAARG